MCIFRKTNVFTRVRKNDHASCYIPDLYDAKKVPLGFLRHFQGMHCMGKYALFKSSGDIY